MTNEYDIDNSPEQDQDETTSFVDYGPDGETVLRALPQMEG